MVLIATSSGTSVSDMLLSGFFPGSCWLHAHLHCAV
jgi:TRAP-type C4-dicarboxylate transport system permease large subunit